MPETTTKAGADDRRPRNAEEVWLAIGPFTQVGTLAVLGLLGLLVVGLGLVVFELDGMRREAVRIRAYFETKGG